MRVSSVGTSWITKAVMAAAREVGWVHTAAYSRDADRAAAFAAACGAETGCSDFDALLRSGADVIYIASPNSLHFPQAMRCLDAGLHVVCEKPMFLRLAEYKEAYALAAERGVYLFEALRHLHSAGFAAVRDNLERIAPVRNAIFSYNQYSSKYDAFLAGDSLPNIFNPDFGGGALMDLGVYPLSMAAALWGQPRRMLNAASPMSTGVDGTGSVLMVYDGFLCTVSYSKLAAGDVKNEIMGERGTISCGVASRLTPIVLRPRGGEPEVLYEAPDISPYLEEMQVFDRIIRERDDAAYEALCTISRDTATLIGVSRSVTAF